MRIEIVNSTRNIRVVPRKASDDPMDQLRELRGLMPEAGSQAVEFQCDEAFFTATGLEERSFEGIPIVVYGEGGQIVPPAPPAEDPAPQVSEPQE